MYVEVVTRMSLRRHSLWLGLCDFTIMPACLVSYTLCTCSNTTYAFSILGELILFSQPAASGLCRYYYHAMGRLGIADTLT